MVMAMNRPDFSGTTKDCAKDFFAQSDWLVAKPLLVQFTQVDGQTVRKWYTEKCMPVGLPLLRLRVFLDLLGYKVQEFNKLSKTAKDFSRCIAFGYISTKEACEKLGYINEKSLFDVVLRGRTPVVDRMYRVGRFVEDSREDLDQLIQDFNERVGGELQLTEELDVPDEEPVGALAIVSASDLEEVEPIVDAIVSTIASADAVVRMLDSDSRADELVIKIAERVDFADLYSLRASLEAIAKVGISNSSESQ